VRFVPQERLKRSEGRRRRHHDPHRIDDPPSAGSACGTLGLVQDVLEAVLEQRRENRFAIARPPIERGAPDTETLGKFEHLELAPLGQDLPDGIEDLAPFLLRHERSVAS
jgi:hypothetical protein